MLHHLDIAITLTQLEMATSAIQPVKASQFSKLFNSKQILIAGVIGTQQINYHIGQTSKNNNLIK